MGLLPWNHYIFFFIVKQSSLYFRVTVVNICCHKYKFRCQGFWEKFMPVVNMDVYFFKIPASPGEESDNELK